MLRHGNTVSCNIFKIIWVAAKRRIPWFKRGVVRLLKVVEWWGLWPVSYAYDDGKFVLRQVSVTWTDRQRHNHYHNQWRSPQCGARPVLGLNSSSPSSSGPEIDSVAGENLQRDGIRYQKRMWTSPGWSNGRQRRAVIVETARPQTRGRTSAFW